MDEDEENVVRIPKDYNISMAKLRSACVVVGVVCVISSLLILFHHDPSSIWGKVLLAGLAELGFALIIAVVVAIIVDLKSHERLTEQQERYSAEIKETERNQNKKYQEREKKLSKNIFDYIYSVKVDKSIFEFIESKIYQTLSTEQV